MIIKAVFNEVLAFAQKWDHLGAKKLQNGAILIGSAPHIAPDAWLHSFFKGLSKSDVSDLEKKIGMKFPDNYVQLLSISNGFHLFNTTLVFDGLVKNLSRKNDDARHPFSFIYR